MALAHFTTLYTISDIKSKPVRFRLYFVFVALTAMTHVHFLALEMEISMERFHVLDLFSTSFQRNPLKKLRNIPT